MFGPNGPYYVLTKEQIQQYHDKGFVSLPNIVTKEELKALEDTYDKFLRQEMAGLGDDLSDITTEMGKPLDSFSAISVMVPRHYAPELRENIFEKRAAHVATQLYGEDMALDLDQFIAKCRERRK